MDIESIRRIDNDTERVNAIYEVFDEDTRLNRSKAARVEFLTSVKYIERYLKPDGKILDLGAGAGEYSLYFAKKGFDVTAVELAENNVKAFRRKLEDGVPITLIHGNACDLSAFEDGTFDTVLMLGPLYHLCRAEDRSKCIREALRVMKPDGTAFFAFISNDMVVLTELAHRPHFFKENSYDHDTFKVEDFPFVFFTIDRMRKMLENEGVSIIHEVASDGPSELMADTINALDDEEYAQYMRYHIYCCEKKEMLGMSNHVLIVGKKRD